MFYKATVLAMFLYGSKTWSLTLVALKSLEDFNLRDVWRMARNHKPCRQLDRSWTYHVTPDVLEEVGLHPIAHYV